MVRSGDGGASWSGAALSGSVSRLAVDPKNSSRVFAVSGNLFRSLDGAQTFVRLASLPFFVTAIAMDPATPTNVYAGVFFLGVSKSTDGGETWRQVRVSATNFSANIVNWIAVDPQNASNLYVATQAGVWKSTAAGENWASTASPGVSATFIAIDSQSTVYAVTLPAPPGGVPGLVKSIAAGAPWTPLGGC